MTLHLEAIIVTNDNHVFDEPGDVRVFLSHVAATESLEASDVLAGGVYAISGDGYRIELVVTDSRVSLRKVDRGHEATLRRWLLAAARAAAVPLADEADISHLIEMITSETRDTH